MAFALCIPFQATGDWTRVTSALIGNPLSLGRQPLREGAAEDVGVPGSLGSGCML